MSNLKSVVSNQAIAEEQLSDLCCASGSLSRSETDRVVIYLLYLEMYDEIRNGTPIESSVGIKTRIRKNILNEDEQMRVDVSIPGRSTAMQVLFNE